MTIKQKTMLRVFMLMTVLILAGPGAARAADDDQPTLFNSGHNQAGAAPLFLNRAPGSAGASASQGTARPYSFFDSRPSQKVFRPRADFEKEVKAKNAANEAAAISVHHQHAMDKLAQSKAAVAQRHQARQARSKALHPKTAAVGAKAAPVSRTAVRPVIDNRPVIYNGQQTSKPLFLPH